MKDIAGTIEETVEKTSSKKQAEIVSTLTESGKRPIVDLEQEWE